MTAPKGARAKGPGLGRAKAYSAVSKSPAVSQARRRAAAGFDPRIGYRTMTPSAKGFDLGAGLGNAIKNFMGNAAPQDMLMKGVGNRIKKATSTGK